MVNTRSSRRHGRRGRAWATDSTSAAGESYITARIPSSGTTDHDAGRLNSTDQPHDDEILSRTADLVQISSMICSRFAARTGFCLPTPNGEISGG